MLVHYYLPKGISMVDNKRVYGAMLEFPPTRVSFETYKNYKDVLVLASYTPEYLSKLFGKPAPNIRFTTKELPHIRDRMLFELADFFGVSKNMSLSKIVSRITEILKDI